MSPPNLHGLNIVQPQPNFDSQDLLATSVFPDLTAQLELWTNLPFESEEGQAVPKNTKRALEEEEEEDLERRGAIDKDLALHDGHVNVVTGTNIATNMGNNVQQHQGQGGAPSATQSGPSFDIGSLLAAYNMDAFAHQVQIAPQPQPPVFPSLAQLLALHSAQNAVQAFSTPTVKPPVSVSTSVAQSSPPFSSPSSTEATASAPATKRQRTRKSSMSSPTGDMSPETAATALSAAEDKRRRNTAASARFRLKKKEREAALESKAKELEIRVTELERECEGLRRENGWLKGLVVGVTGAAQGTAQALPAASSGREETGR